MGFRDTVKHKVKTYLERGTLHWNTSEFLRRATWGTVGFSLVLAAALYVTQGLLWGVAGLLFGVFMAASFFMFLLTYSPYRKSQEIEALLPEALELIASNLKAGLTTREALKLLVSDQYEPLSSEVSRALAQESMGAPLKDALLETQTRVQSRLYDKVVQSIARGIETGANLEDVCRSLARNINDIRSIRETIRASALSYTTFLSFATLIAAPLLFALSTFLIDRTSTLMETALQGAGGSGGNIPTAFAAIGQSLPPVDLLTNFFITVLVITAGSTSISIGIVNRGNALEGVKLMPFFIAFTLAVYWIGVRVIGAFLGGFI